MELSYISRDETLNFSAQAQEKKKKKKNSTSRKFLILHEMKTPQKILIFSQMKAVLTFWEAETPKKLFIFQETELNFLRS